MAQEVGMDTLMEHNSAATSESSQLRTSVYLKSTRTLASTVYSTTPGSYRYHPDATLYYLDEWQHCLLYRIDGSKVQRREDIPQEIASETSWKY